MKPITRSDAAALNATHYFTGKPCKYGHVARRFVSTGSCTACHARQQQHQRERASLADAHLKRVPYWAVVPVDMTERELNSLFLTFTALIDAAVMDRGSNAPE